MGNTEPYLQALLEAAQSFAQLPRAKRMYAIVFDLDQETLAKTYLNENHKNAFEDIKNALEPYGFMRQQGSVFFGDAEKVDAVSCVLAIIELSATYSWFSPSVKDIRMLRIEDNNDLIPAVKKGATSHLFR
jgi:virulence-associated protein VapD